MFSIRIDRQKLCILIRVLIIAIINCIGFNCPISSIAAGPTDWVGQWNFTQKFDGIDDYISLEANPNYNPGEANFTVMFWMKSLETGKLQFLASKGNSATYSEGWSFFVGGENIYFRINAANSDVHLANEGTGFTDTASWHHVAGVIDRDAGLIKAYLDAQRMGPAWLGNSVSGFDHIGSGDALEIGRSSSDNFYFSGYIDDLRIYKRVLSEPEISACANVPFVDFSFIISADDPLTVNFDAKASQFEEGTIESYLWDFGDGLSGTGVTITHDYEMGGNYYVTLKIKSDKGEYKKTKLFKLTSTNPLFENTTVFKESTEGYPSFRIPSIINAPNGNLLAFCEGRLDGSTDYGNHDIVMKRSSDYGRTWMPIEVIVDHNDFKQQFNWHTVFCGDPTPLVDKITGTIWLFVSIIGNYLPDSNHEHNVWVLNSSDNGITWSVPVNITNSVMLPNWNYNSLGPCHAIQLESGKLFIMGNHKDETDKYQSHCFFSDDHGTTWKLGGTVGPDTNESTAVQLVNGNIMMNMRNYRNGGFPGRRAIAISKDEGLTWGPIWDDGYLIEPRCQASIIRFTNNTTHRRNRILFSNPASSTIRENMTVKVSYDEGQTWNSGKSIYKNGAAYSDLVIMDDNSIGCLYEVVSGQIGWKTISSIDFARFDIEWATNGEDKLVSRPFGDIDCDFTVGLSDAILTLQILVSNDDDFENKCFSDINGNKRIDLGETIFILQKISDIR